MEPTQKEEKPTWVKKSIRILENLGSETIPLEEKLAIAVKKNPKNKKLKHQLTKIKFVNAQLDNGIKFFLHNRYSVPIHASSTPPIVAISNFEKKTTELIKQIKDDLGVSSKQKVIPKKVN